MELQLPSYKDITALELDKAADRHAAKMELQRSGLSLLSINGIRPGMSRQQIEKIFGQHRARWSETQTYGNEPGFFGMGTFTVVDFDERDKALRVSGANLEFLDESLASNLFDEAVPADQNTAIHNALGASRCVAPGSRYFDSYRLRVDEDGEDRPYWFILGVPGEDLRQDVSASAAF